MKDLITVFSFSPDYKRKELLHKLLLELQVIRDKFDIMVVSHSPISDISLGLIDYFYFEAKNEIIHDFSYTNIFWYSSNQFAINSSLVYPQSTHLAIYSLLYYTFDFARHKGYNKIHFIEFDLKLEDYHFINEVNKDLDTYDAVVFQTSSSWTMGVYFASTLNGFDINRFRYDKDEILHQLSEIDSRMTERVTPFILCEGRNYKSRHYNELNGGKECQLNDEHNHNDLKWAVPLQTDGTEEVVFFIYNESGLPHIVDLFVDDKYYKFDIEGVKGAWSLTHIGFINNINEIIILVDKKETNRIKFNESNRKNFGKNNFVKHLI